MDKYKFECPNCGQHLAIPAEMAGQTFACPTCGQALEFEVPIPDAEPKPQGASDSTAVGDIGQVAPTNGDEPSAEMPAVKAPSKPSSKKSERVKAKIGHLKQRLRAACRIAVPWLVRVAKQGGKLAANGFSKAVAAWRGFDRKTRKRVGIAVAAVGVALVTLAIIPKGRDSGESSSGQSKVSSSHDSRRNDTLPTAKDYAFHSVEEINAYIKKCREINWDDVALNPERYAGKDVAIYCKDLFNERPGYYFDVQEIENKNHRWLVNGGVSSQLHLKPIRPNRLFLENDEIAVFGKVRDNKMGGYPRVDGLFICDMKYGNKENILSGQKTVLCRTILLDDGTSVDICNVSRQLWMGKTEVTQQLWTSVMGENPSENKGDSLPVENVSWNDCQQFLKKFNSLPEVEKSGFTFRLPTQEEWRTACQTGAKSSYDGDSSTDWTQENSKGETHSVGAKDAGMYGLHDMNGNVSEWTQTEDGNEKLFCGGAYLLPTERCNADANFSEDPDARKSYIGFRLCANPRK